MSAKKWCDEDAVIRQYRAGMPIVAIRKDHHISQNRLYGILRARGIKQRMPRRAADRTKTDRAADYARCGCCGQKFQPYSIDGQRCTRLCPVCWQRYSRPRRDFAAEVVEEAAG
jgi:hypothetical protein